MKQAPQPEQQAKSKYLSREAEAKLALEHTQVKRAWAWVLVVAFLVIIYSVPLFEQANDVVEALHARRQGQEVSLWPKAYSIFKLLPKWKEVVSVRGVGDFLDLLPTSKELKNYESTLEQDSRINAWILPRSQYVLTRYFGLGNEKAYLGLKHWLFYKLSFDHLLRAGFRQQGRQSGSIAASNLQTGRRDDSLAAILDFKRQLEAHGIKLLVVPMPAKPTIQPEFFTDRYADWPAPVHNPAFKEWKHSLEAAGVPVFDPAPLLWRRKSQGKPQYLATDTHWTPEAMASTAEALARFIEQQRLLPPGSGVAYRLRRVQVANTGDIARMLKLPSWQKLYLPQQVTLEQVLQPDGEPWEPDEKADVLLLGDSFSNIYSLKGMGWGKSAGFTEHLSYKLHRPLDKIAINAGGAYTARLELVRSVAKGENRLAGKRLVIYEFAARELSEGDWRLLQVFPATSKAAKGGNL